MNARARRTDVVTNVARKRRHAAGGRFVELCVTIGTLLVNVEHERICLPRHRSSFNAYPRLKRAQARLCCTRNVSQPNSRVREEAIGALFGEAPIATGSDRGASSFGKSRALAIASPRVTNPLSFLAIALPDPALGVVVASSCVPSPPWLQRGSRPRCWRRSCRAERAQSDRRAGASTRGWQRRRGAYWIECEDGHGLRRPA